jgi:dTDP-4-dehydrorhamnose 3,5-epimerase
MLIPAVEKPAGSTSGPLRGAERGAKGGVGAQHIEGVRIVPLRQIADERGKIMHMMKATDDHFAGFGEIYFSCAWPGAVKAWHIHQRMRVSNAVISGRAKLAMYDLRGSSNTRGVLQEVFLGEDNYVLVQIPPGVANGYKAYGDKLVILANCADIPHDPDEMLKRPPDDPSIPYDWGLRNG